MNERTEDVVVETVEEDDGETCGNDEEDDQPDPNVDPGAAKKTFLRSAMEDAVNQGGNLPTIDVTDTLGRTFITSPNESGEQVRAQIESAEFTQQRTSDEMEPLLRFKCKVGEERF